METRAFTSETAEETGVPTRRGLGGYALEGGWAKSSYSCDTANCVQAAVEVSPSGQPQEVIVGDTKNPGAEIRVSPEAWRDFIAAACSDSFSG